MRFIFGPHSAMRFIFGPHKEQKKNRLFLVSLIFVCITLAKVLYFSCS